MSWKSWLWIIPLVLILLGLGIWFGWYLMGNAVGVNTAAEDNGRPVTQGANNADGDAVNTPAPDNILVFQNPEAYYQNGHDFIRYFHHFYNESLGWGRIQTASYSEQKSKAESVIYAIDNIQKVTNEDLRKDIEEIKKLAQKVTNKDDRDAMKKLHRYFHDLDIYLNGYDYDQTFKITHFKGMK